MNDLLRAIGIECFKLRRTLALWASLLVPLLVIVMTTALGLSRGAGARFLPEQTSPWDGMTGVVLSLWCLVGLPLFIALMTALLAGLEHREHAWRHLFTLPIPRWTIYMAKLLVGGGLLCLSACILAVGMALEGVLIHALRPGLGLSLPIPWDLIGSRTLSFVGASLLMLAVQTWVAIRWRSFVVALTLGIGGSVTTVVLRNVNESSSFAPVARFFPWAQPYFAFMYPQMSLFVVAIVGGVLVAALGCFEVVRRDVE